MDLKNHFTPKSVTDKKKLFIGLALLVGGLVLGAILMALDQFVLGVIVAVVSFFMGLVLILTNKKLEYMSGEEYDMRVKQMTASLGTNAMEYVGLDSSELEEIEPISFEGYKFVGAKKVMKDPKDQMWRSDLYEKAIVFFTNSEVHLYKVFLDILTGKKTETTDVFFYDDIVSVSTKNEVEQVGGSSVDYTSSNLTSKGGNSVSVALYGNEDRQKSINAMRAMIKEKKTQ